MHQNEWGQTNFGKSDHIGLNSKILTNIWSKEIPEFKWLDNFNHIQDMDKPLNHLILAYIVPLHDDLWRDGSYKVK